MVYEMVVQAVDPARRDEHVARFKKTLRESNFAGFHGGQALTSVEDPSKVIMLLEWDTVEAHQEHRGTPTHNRFRDASREAQTAPGSTEHFEFEAL